MASLSIGLQNSNGPNLAVSTVATRDWMIFDGATIVRKASVVALCNAFCETNSAVQAPTGQTADNRGYARTWTGGTPTASGSSDGCLKGSFQFGGGYVFCFYADTTSRTAVLWCPGTGVSNTTLRARATLSDGSAAPATLTYGDAGSNVDIITVTYTAGVDGAVLVVVLSNDTSDIHDIAVAAIGATGTGGVASAVPTLSTVGDPSFEVGTTWTIAGNAGIQTNGNPLLPITPYGTQFNIMAWDAGGTQGSALQSITPGAGQYILGLCANQEASSSAQTLGALFDATVVMTGIHDNYGKDGGFQKFASGIFSLAAGARVLKLIAEVQVGAGKYTCVDNVTLLKLPAAGAAPPPPPPATASVVNVVGISSTAASVSGVSARVYAGSPEVRKFSVGRAGYESTTPLTFPAAVSGSVSISIPIPGTIVGAAFTIGDAVKVYFETDPESTGSCTEICPGTVA